MKVWLEKVELRQATEAVNLLVRRLFSGEEVTPSGRCEIRRAREFKPRAIDVDLGVPKWALNLQSGTVTGVVCSFWQRSLEKYRELILELLKLVISWA